MEHDNHVHKAVVIPFGEGNCSLERPVGVNDAAAWPILLTRHVSRTLTIHHIWLLNTTKARK